MTQEEIQQAALEYSDEYNDECFDATGWRCPQIVNAFKAGALWAEKSLWKPADGDDLPEIDREVIVLRCPYQLNPLAYSVSFAHRPDPNGWTGKSISTGEIKHYEAKTFDKGGWSIPGVLWWLDLKLPEGGEK